MDPKQEAKDLLVHYIDLATGGAGDRNEIERIVDLIVLAAADEMHSQQRQAYTVPRMSPNT